MAGTDEQREPASHADRGAGARGAASRATRTARGERPGRPATLADVARASGVAASTVSRALSDPGRVNATTRERIERIARELDYTPNTQARALISGRTRAVAVLVSDVTNPFYFGMIRGTQQQLRVAGYTQLLVDTEESEELEASVLRRLRQSCDGAVIAGPRLADERLEQLADDFPLVVVNRQDERLSTVFLDTPSGYAQSLAHLVSLGHRDIAYVAGPDASSINESRWLALETAAREHDVALRRIGPFSPTKQAGAAAADAVLNSGVTACVAFNDLLAIGMLMRLHERGVPVPDRLSIVGCDDIFGADFCNPPLTTITAPIERAGRVAIDLLLAKLDAADEAPARSNVTLPTHLTIRASTGAAPADAETGRRGRAVSGARGA
jgi:DNA-binding LacI/PurR family transcriptional regulator